MSQLLHRFNYILCDCQLAVATQCMTCAPEVSKSLLSQLLDVYEQIFGINSPEYEVSTFTGLVVRSSCTLTNCILLFKFLYDFLKISYGLANLFLIRDHHHW
jgi:hypothetical protein